VRSRFVLDEQYKNKYDACSLERERTMNWLKDVAAGVGLVCFVASSFALTAAAQAIFSS
jgi:hypothetical protein